MRGRVRRPRRDLDPDRVRETAVARLYAWWHDEDGEDVGNEQGGAYVFAYLLEREGLVEPAEGPAIEGGTPASLTARQPEDDALEALPQFELDYGVDDRREPTEITIYDPLAEDVTTRWLTADAASTIDLAEVA